MSSRQTQNHSQSISTVEVLFHVDIYANISACAPQLSRNQRFSAPFHHTVETLVNMMMPHITQKYKDNLDAAQNANHSLAVFIKVRIQVFSGGVLSTVPYVEIIPACVCSAALT